MLVKRFRPSPAVARPVVALLCTVTLLMGIVLGYSIGQAPTPLAAGSGLTDQPGFQTLEEVWNLVHNHFVDPDIIDDQALLYGAASGMMDAVGDQGHTGFLDPTDAKAFRASLNGELIGIGVQLDFEGSYPKVTAPIPDSPADEAGIERGDLITRVNGVSTKGWSNSDIARALRGEEGDRVDLTLERPDDDSQFDVSLVRRRITLVPVSYAWLPGEVALVRLNEFSAGASKKLTAALTAIMAKHPTGIVLDLRGNPGGYVSEAISVASNFMKEGTTVYLQQDRDETPKPVSTDESSPVAPQVALVVLVDGSSASSSELVAAALKDNHRAQIVGETTFGTGTVVSSYNLDDGSIASIGTSFWLTPSGQQLWKKGLDPDISVPLPPGGEPVRFAPESTITSDQIEAFEDDQLLVALDILEDSAK